MFRVEDCLEYCLSRRIIIKLYKTYIAPALVKENVIILQFMHNRLRDCYRPILVP